MTDTPKQAPEYVSDLKTLENMKLKLGPAYAEFAGRLETASKGDITNYVLAQAADNAAEGAMAYQAGDEERGKKLVEQADNELSALFFYTAGAKKIGSEEFGKLKGGQIVETAQKAGAELYARFRRARSLIKQAESAKRELGGLEEFIE